MEPNAPARPIPDDTPPAPVSPAAVEAVPASPLDPAPPSAPLDPPSVPDAPPVSEPLSAVEATPAAVPPPLAEPPLLVPPAPPPPEPARFTFHGDAREYFSIWIVNTLLSVVTLGVFSAWAKVRKRRYLRGNTELLGHRFDYTASPLRLLVGNLLVALLFLAYGLFGTVYPAVRIGAVLVFAALLPWIVVRSLSFNAHNTMYRGLRFRFHPSLSSAVMLYLFQPLMIVLSLGFYYPAWARHRQEFAIGRHRLGTAYFRLSLTSGRFYQAYLVAAAMIFGGLLAIGALYGFWLKNADGHVPSTLQLVPSVLLYAAVAYVAKHYIFAEIFNLTWNETRLDDHRFRARLDTGHWIRLQCVNLLAIVATCGLAYPWAVVRSTRYALSCLEFHPAGPLGDIVAMGQADGSAVGDTAAEFAGLDFGL
ncbi:MAG: DUF898 family protein [Verrucomicrobia bacterium]|nr:DUF898 family protein [Verrucomicrobiota bacterium]